ncbi:MAG: 1,4-alpha-glucan-branching protein, partial [Bacteroidota bacterium]
VINHSFGLNPQVRMFFDEGFGGYGSVSTENPWFNQIATHPFSVGYDYNHESSWTRSFFKDVFSHWIQEYHIDGFRLDLSKGLTQTQTGQDVGAWNNYDQSRVNILFDYANHVWSTQPGTYMILEHLGGNNEETALANGGFMLWGVMSHEYGEAAMGYGGDLSWGVWQNRGWNWPNLITYAESHDEERVAYQTQNYGALNNGYDVKDFSTAMQRQILMHTFLIPMPGPKMMWQRGELGYDYSINDCNNGTIDPSCRTQEKPERWDYFDDPESRELFKKVAALNHLKTNYSTFSTYDFTMDLGGTGKRMLLFHPEMDAVICGNFDTQGFDMVPGFSHSGTW